MRRNQNLLSQSDFGCVPTGFAFSHGGDDHMGEVGTSHPVASPATATAAARKEMVELVESIAVAVGGGRVAVAVAAAVVGLKVMD